MQGREREALSSLALHLLEAKLIISFGKKGKGSPAVWEAKEGAGFPAETRTRQNSGQRPAERHSELPAAPGSRLLFGTPATCSLSPLGLRPTDPSFHPPCLNVPRSGAALLPLARSRKRVSGPGNAVLVDSAPLVKKEKFWGRGGGGSGGGE